MRMSFLEWAARVAMLVLAGMVTLSILGSIAAISNRPFPDRTAVAPGDLPPRTRPAVPPPAAEPAPAAPAPGSPPAAPPEDVAAPADALAAVPAGAAAAGEDRWLEAIAYALLALAGLFAIAVLLLWNALRQLRRIADAAEARGRN